MVLFLKVVYFLNLSPSEYVTSMRAVGRRDGNSEKEPCTGAGVDCILIV